MINVCRELIATIPISTTKSLPIALDGASRGSFAIPASFTGTAMTFEISNDSGVTFTPLYSSSNTAVSITVAVSRAYPLPSEVIASSYFKFVSGSTESAARSIQVALS